MLDPGIVDQDIAGPGLFDQRAAFVALGHVGLDVTRGDAGLLRDVGGERVILLPVGEGVQNDIRPGRASSRAMPSPMPEFDPVMTAVLPPRSVVMAMGVPSCLNGSR
jgi:hypothetical protein